LERQIIDILNQLVDGQKVLKVQVNAVMEEVADLKEFKTEMLGFKTEMLDFKTEMLDFKTEMLDFKQETTSQLKEINHRMSKVELITSSNWNDLIRLKALEKT
jgi:predicted  nucleic acid-binding Zn-ribbon protein